MFQRQQPAGSIANVGERVEAEPRKVRTFGEGLARVYLETQACARVLIASDIPPAREVIDDGETGLLFPVGNVEQLAECCIRAARDSDLRARLGRAGLARVQRHDVGRAVTSYLDAFAAIAERTSG